MNTIYDCLVGAYSKANNLVGSNLLKYSEEVSLPSLASFIAYKLTNNTTIPEIADKSILGIPYLVNNTTEIVDSANSVNPHFGALAALIGLGAVAFLVVRKH